MEIGGWLIPHRFFCKAELVTKLWVFTRGNRDTTGERQVQLFFLGWYDKPNSVKMWTLVILGFSLQIQVVI